MFLVCLNHLPITSYFLGCLIWITDQKKKKPYVKCIIQTWHSVNSWLQLLCLWDQEELLFYAYGILVLIYTAYSLFQLQLELLLSWLGWQHIASILLGRMHRVEGQIFMSEQIYILLSQPFIWLCLCNVVFFLVLITYFFPFNFDSSG